MNRLVAKKSVSRRTTQEFLNSQTGRGKKHEIVCMTFSLEQLMAETHQNRQETEVNMDKYSDGSNGRKYGANLDMRSKGKKPEVRKGKTKGEPCRRQEIRKVKRMGQTPKF